MPFSGSGTGIQNADDVFFSSVSDGDTLLYNAGTAKWNNSSGAPAADVVLSIAADDTPATLKSNADYVCDGTADDVQVQAAIDSLTNGGEVVLLPGNHSWAATVKLRVERLSLRFLPGARVKWSSVTGRTPLIQVLKSNSYIWNADLEGSGVKGNGIGIQIGGQASTEPIVGADQPGGVHVIYPRCYSMDTGVEFGIQSDGSQSVGDCVVWGGRINNIKTGIRSAGFVNYVHSPFISSCDVGIEQTADRYSGRVVVSTATINQWAVAAIRLRRGRGSEFGHIWAEHTATQSAVPTECVLIDPVGSDEVINPKFGTMHLHPIDVADGTPELYGVRLSGRIDGLSIDHMEMTDELPSAAIIRGDADFEGGSNIIKKVSFGNNIPASYAHSMLLNNAGAGSLAVFEVPGPANSVAGTTVGGTTPIPASATYYVDVSGAPNAATYWAKAQNGHIAMMSADTATTSGLKAVLESLASDNVHFQFGPKRYHFLDAPVGNESYAGAEDHASYGQAASPTTGLAFSGSGMKNTIISSRTNWSGTVDVEPFSFTNCQYVTIRDMTIEACGSYKSTTDAIDFDQGSNCLVERVRVTRSRARAIVVDGGDNGKNATNNTLRDCIIQGRPDKPGLTLSSGGSLSTSTTYRYAVSWVDSDLAGAQSSGETKLSEVSLITTDSSNLSVRVNIPIGPYSTTARKIYRAPSGSASWVLVSTVNDNTTTTYIDNGGAGSGVSMPVSHRSTIFSAGIELLGSSGNTILNNVIDGVGDSSVGANLYGINLVRKGSGSSTVNSDRNIVMGNMVRQSSSYGIRILGGSDNEISNNIVINPGTVASKAQCIRIDNATSATTNNNTVQGNRCIDDQDANSWTTGKTTNNMITITSTNSPTNNRLITNVLDAGASAARISDSGVTSFIKNNSGYNPVGTSAVSVGASPYVYTAGSSPEAIYATGGTVSSIVKNGVTIFTSTPATISLEPNESVTITYSSAPTVNKDVK